MINKKNTEKKKSIKIFKIIGICLISFVIIFVFLFYGPISWFKETWITSAMTSMSHQWMAEILYSDSDIAKVVEKNKFVEVNLKTDTSLINAVDQNKESEVIDISRNGFKGWIIKIYNPSKVKLVFSENIGKSGEKLVSIMKRYDAISGINASGFMDTSGHTKGSYPIYIAMKDGELLWYDKTQLSYNIVGISKDNKLVIGNYTLDQIKSGELRDAISFLPKLIVNGVKSEINGNGGWGIAPRTAIGQTADGTFIFLCIDGRQMYSFGATLKDVQDIMAEYGAVNAVNLDGGASSIMMYKGKNVNYPTTSRTGRYLPSAFIEVK